MSTIDTRLAAALHPEFWTDEVPGEATEGCCLPSAERLLAALPAHGLRLSLDTPDAGLRAAAQAVVDIVEGPTPTFPSTEDEARWYYEWEVGHRAAVAALRAALAAAPREGLDERDGDAPVLNEYDRAVCVCGETVLPENWPNHLMRKGYHRAPASDAEQPYTAPRAES